jgi:type II secretory pathway predicted ATPase ExeA/TPR repeat protein
MYQSHYNLAEKPFQLTTDPKFLWLGEKHKEALATLKYGVIEQKGFLLVTGDVGMGKTTLINALLETIDENTLVANIKDPALNLIDFYNLIAISFDIPQKFESKVDFIVYFSQFLKKVYSKNKGVLLIIDEVHSLSKELLEHIRLLSNIEFPEEKLLNVFLVGQNEIHQTLALPQFRAIRQRISLAYQIQPLSERETSEYIKHRLKVAGTEKEIFTQSAVSEVYRFSNGYPRLINIICDLSLLTGYSRDLKEITPDIVQECSQEYSFINKTVEETPSNSKVQYHRESRSHYVDNPFSEDMGEEATASEKTTTRDVSSSHPAFTWESSNLTQETRNHDAKKVIEAVKKQIEKQLFFLKTVASFASRFQKKLFSKLFSRTNLVVVATRLRNRMSSRKDLVSFATRMQKRLSCWATVVSTTARSRKRLFFWAPAVSLALIAISFIWFSQKEGTLKDLKKKSAVSALNTSTTSAVKSDPFVTRGTLEKDTDKILSNQSQKSPPADASKTLQPSSFELAKKAFDHKNFSRAIELFDQAIAQHPANASAIKYYYSKALREQANTILAKDPDTSKKLLVQAIEADPKNAEAFFDLGKLNTKSKDYKKAIIAYQEAAYLNYRSPDTFYNLGFIYASTKDYATAEKMFLRAIDLKPQYLDKALFNLAVVQQKQGKKQQSIENLEKALKINPNNQRAQEYLHQLKNERGVS